ALLISASASVTFSLVIGASSMIGSYTERFTVPLLSDGDDIREAVDSDVHSALARVEGRPGLPHRVPSPDRLGRQSLQQQEPPTAQRRRHDESALVVFEGGHDRMEVPQS
ncbi:hypothetical protein ACIP6P_03535, partial [Streptomyces sp. NPDC088729]|uniref:hypothetical protein n=1 Tax=Streptomyces sp. NPDC088729 TaxID=3365876 RepID=UPI00381A7ECE